MKKVIFAIFATFFAFSWGFASHQVEENIIEATATAEGVAPEEPVMAPNFTLKDLDGKDVSLSDFKGKWVILDFWGSWCPWCIKGFPELKEAYSTYGDKLVILGIDCRESETDWRAGVEKYQLPWVNVYNPSESNLTSIYGIQGYPTKFIVNPEGLIVNETIGHDPEFFNVLSNLIGE